jgi:RNA polymerase sigma-70 factor (ECF subfamily)
MFARQQARNSADAEDLLQEAFVRMWRLYGHTGEVPPALVYRAIRRLAIDWARSLDRRVIREDSVAADMEKNSWFDRSMERNERRDALLKAVHLLPFEQKEVITLKIWGEQTFDEIAKTLGISLNTAASRYRYAMSKLKKSVPELLSEPRGEDSK